MKACVLRKPCDIQIEEIEIPKIKENEMLIEMRVCGMCNSELPDYIGGNDSGRILGHEPVGIVKEVGMKVKNFGPGDRVSGIFQNAFAEYTVTDEKLAVKVPENLSDEEAIAEPWSCLISGLRRVDIQPGSTAAVIGCGYMGLGVIALMKLRGVSRIIAVDIRPSSLGIAAKLGADEVYTPDTVPDVYILDEWKDNLFAFGVSVVVEATGKAAGLKLAERMIKPHGVLSMVGYHCDGQSREINMKMWNWKAITVINAHERRDNVQMECLKEALDLIAEGRLTAAKLLTHEFYLEDINEAFSAMQNKKENYIKGFIRIGDQEV